MLNGKGCCEFYPVRIQNQERLFSKSSRPRWRMSNRTALIHRLLKIDIDARKGRLSVPGVTEGYGEPIRTAVTGEEHRARIDLPHGFEYTLAEMGRGWTKAIGPIKFELADSYGQFAHIHLSQSGVVH